MFHRVCQAVRMTRGLYRLTAAVSISTRAETQRTQSLAEKKGEAGREGESTLGAEAAEQPQRSVNCSVGSMRRRRLSPRKEALCETLRPLRLCVGTNYLPLDK